MAGLDPVEARRLVAGARVGRLATVTVDGRPHVVPCCYALVDDTLYSVVDAKPKSTPLLRRLDNIRANPLASLLVDHYDDDWSQLWWVRADGSARVIDGSTDRTEYEGALDALADRYRQYRAERPTGSMVAVDVNRWSGWAHRS